MIDRFFNDRSFWIYFIVTTFFIILGVQPLFQNLDIYSVIFWVVANYLLMAMVYLVSVRLSPRDNNDCAMCLIDCEVDFHSTRNRAWFWINIFYIILLVLSVIWAWSIYDSRLFIGAIILIVISIMISICCQCRYEQLCSSFYLSILYLLVWILLLFYQVVKY